MKMINLSGIPRRAMALLLAALTLAPLCALPPLARADEAKYNATTTPITVWDKLSPSTHDAEQCIKQSNYKDPKAKWDRIMIYQPKGDDYQYFNTDGQRGADMKANNIQQEDDCRVNHYSHSEWSQDFKDYNQFVTVTGLGTPYVEYTGWKTYSKRDGASHHKGWETCRLWLANKSDDSRSGCELAFTGTWRALEVIRHSASDRYTDWIISNGILIRASGLWQGSDHFVIWQFDNNGVRNDNLTKGDKYFDKSVVNTLCEVQYWNLCLGKTWNVPTLSTDYSIDGDQISTFGRPLFYVPEGRTITVKAGGILSIDGVLLNDGVINVEEGGLLILKDNAKIFPFSRNKNVGQIVSRGSVVVETNALLCGGAVNGVSIEGGGVVNFGIICAQQLNITAPNLVENRKSGYIVAGRAPSRRDRISYIAAATAERPTSKPNVSSLVQYSGSLECKSTFSENAVYGYTNQVQRYGSQVTKAAPLTPKMTVYTRNSPQDVNTPLVSDASPNAVKFRTVNGKPVVSVGKKDYDVSDKLVSAVITKGERTSEKVFEDRWAGGLENAYVRIVRPEDTGQRIKINFDSREYNERGRTNASLEMSGLGGFILSLRQSNDEWWQLAYAGTVDGRQTYYIDNCEYMWAQQPSISVSSDAEVSAGEAAQVSGRARGAGNEHKWILDDAGGGNVYFRSAADPGMSLTYMPNARGAEASIQLQPNDEGNKNQKWRLYDFLNEQNYNRAVSVAAAVEMAPLSDAERRLDGQNTAAGGAVSVGTQDSTTGQLWTFEQAGSDNLGGVVTPYYRVANARTGSVLTVKDDQASANTPVVLEGVNERSVSGQFWYVTQIKSGEYAVRPRGDTNLALAVSQNATVLQPDRGKANQRWKLVGKANLELTDAAEAPPEEEDPYNGKVISFNSVGAPGMGIEVVGDAEKGTAELQIQPAKAAEKQRWAVERAGNVFRGAKLVPYYNLRSLSSGRYLASDALDAASGNGDAYPTLAPYNESGNDTAMSQQWFLEDLGDGQVSIVPRSASAKNISVAGGAKNAGGRVVFRDKSSTADEKWTAALSVEPETYGTFSLTPKHAENMVASVAGNSNANSANVQLASIGDTKYNNWIFVKMGADEKLGDYYRIQNAGSSKVMDVPGVNAPTAGANVQQYDYDGYGDQLWYLQEAEKGRGTAIYYYVANYANPELVLEAADAGGSLSLQTKTKSDRQMWQTTVITPSADLGTYEIIPSETTMLRLHILDDSRDEKKNICIDNRLGDPMDQWKLIRRGSDTVDGESVPYYSIENVVSQKVLDLPGEGEAAATEGASVRQMSYDGNADQHWYMVVQSDNSVSFRNRANKKMALAIDEVEFNADVLLAEYSSRDKMQRWQLHPVMKTERTQTSVRYYIPGNAAAAEAGVPFTNALDRDLQPMEGLFRFKYAAFPQRMFMSFTGSAMGLPEVKEVDEYRLKEDRDNFYGTRIEVIPVGVDYFDGKGRVVYAICSEETDPNVQRAFQQSGWTRYSNRSFLQATLGQNQPPILWDKASVLDWRNQLLSRCLWYLDPVSGKENTYYIMAFGTNSVTDKANAKLCIGKEYRAGFRAQNLKLFTQKNDPNMQWIIEPIEVEDEW